MPQVIQLRRGTAAQWTSANPVLAEGEIGLELDTRKHKIGNGTANWASLPYVTGIPAGGTTSQVLAKTSGADYDAGWVTAAGGMNWKGTYSAVATYATGDVVAYNNNLYIAPAAMAAGTTPGTTPGVVSFKHSDQSGPYDHLAIAPNVTASWSYPSFPAETGYLYLYFDVTTGGTVTIDVTQTTGSANVMTRVSSPPSGALVNSSNNASDFSITATVQRYYLKVAPFTAVPVAGTVKVVPGTAVVATPSAVPWTLMVKGNA